ncbi:neuronal growth regulator 1-like [Anopheles nili]|uniref:neuronal growth regulator 1-like n=1 Tax=Anopheles nili TaxID=185578 RepID=UPI00237A91DA|nr:neuronal growth regulator 1-like [Anopheles nili]
MALPQSSISVSKELHSKQEAVESPTDDYDEDYDDDEDVPSQEKPEISDNALLGTNLLTKSYVEKARPSEQVTLKCEVSNPTSQTIILWYYKDKPIFQHRAKLTSDPRYTLNTDFSLQIDNVQLVDEGPYSCQLLPNNKTIKIELQLLTPPRDVHIMHGNKIINDSVEVHQRDRKFILFCSAKGHPTPQTTWSYRGRHLDEEYSRQIGIVLRKEFLEFHEVKINHAGDYECLAQNGMGNPVTRTVTVVVKDDSSEELEDDDAESSNVTAPLDKGSPVIHKHSGYINTAIGENVEMVCLYESNPAPRKIKWFRDDELLQPVAGQTIITNDRHNHHDRTRLTLRNVQQKDLKAYYCKIENDLGDVASKTIIGMQPGGAHLVHSNYSSNGLLNTWWKVHSLQQITEMQVLYRGENTKYATVNAEYSSHDHNQDGYTWTIHKSIRLPQGVWYVTARARNTEGWTSAESLPHKFEVPDNIQVASIGGSSDGHRTLPVLPSVLLLLLVPFVKSLVY